jgi:hypothetical protein
MQVQNDKGLNSRQGGCRPRSPDQETSIFASTGTMGMIQKSTTNSVPGWKG